MHDKDKLESVPVKAKEDSEAKVELDKGNIDKLYAMLLKDGVNENVPKNFDGGMHAHSALTSIEKTLDKKAEKNKLAVGNSNESTKDLGTFL